MSDSPLNLPIYEHVTEIEEAVSNNQVTVLVGETGSGKTTQLPLILKAKGLAGNGVLGVTEPRRMAATETAKFAADQINEPLGRGVGYKVRFDNKVSDKTQICFMTDGTLLEEMKYDPDLSRYSTIMLDEAHERSVNIDLLLGLLKDLLDRRPDLRLVVSSATIDPDMFADYFGGAPIIDVDGRTYPVDVQWGKDYYSRQEQAEAVVEKVADIHYNHPEGDVLVFTTGKGSIKDIIEQIEDEQLDDLVVLPAHGSLSPQDQQKIFRDYPEKRKVVVATNIAETSLTIDGIRYVVDTGLIKEVHFHPDTGIQSLDVVEHSQAGCKQRKGRAGRTQPGKCFRLYSKENFRERPDYTEPEIKRKSLANVVLRMLSMGITEVEEFDFLDAPDSDAFHEAYETLVALGAITADRENLTEIGKKMANLPLAPQTARMVLAAEEYGCVKEVVTVAAFLSARNPFVRPDGKENEADRAHLSFEVSSSDALTFLNVWQQYKATGFDWDWCYDNFLSSKALEQVRNIRKQLLRVLRGRDDITISESDSDESIRKSVAAGLIQNLMVKTGSRNYSYNGPLRDLYGIFIFPGSSTFGANPEFMVFNEVMDTSKRYARGCSQVDPKWLPDLAPEHFRFGQKIIVEYHEDDDTAIAKQDVIDREREKVVATNRFEVSLDEARKIQESAIDHAESGGWKKLSFYPGDGFSWEAEDESGTYELYGSRHEVEGGQPYFCAIEEPLISSSNPRAKPKFRIYDFSSEDQEVSSGTDESGSTVEDLAEHWETEVQSI